MAYFDISNFCILLLKMTHLILFQRNSNGSSSNLWKYCRFFNEIKQWESKSDVMRGTFSDCLDWNMTLFLLNECRLIWSFTSLLKNFTAKNQFESFFRIYTSKLFFSWKWHIQKAGCQILIQSACSEVWHRTRIRGQFKLLSSRVWSILLRHNY